MVKRALALMAVTCMLRPALAQVSGGNAAPRRMPVRTIDTPYYTLHTDVSDAEAREADLRMTRMFEEYQRRTAGFAGGVKTKFPFFLLRTERDYLAAGGPPGSVGVFIRSTDPPRLMAIAGPKTDAETWNTIQHEGFHQFAAAAIPFSLPPWANEGLAEYFGEAVWTGDGFVTGLVPPGRMKVVQAGMRSGQFKPFRQLMAMTQREWNDDLAGSNYDEAWSMIHFLANAENGRFQAPFLQFMQQVSKGVTNDNAWAGTFGRDIDGFQVRYAGWWSSMPENPTRAAYIKAVVLTETSFLARAFLMKKTFNDPEVFFKEYAPPEFGVNRDLWLPPELFKEHAEIAPKLGKWSFTTGTLPKLVLVTDNGVTYTGSFALNNGKVAKVEIAITQTATRPATRP